MAETKITPVMKKKRKKLSNMRNAEKKHVINVARKSRMKTFVNKFEQAIANKLSKNEILKAFSDIQSELMKGASKKVIQKKTASRKISRMSKRLQFALA